MVSISGRKLNEKDQMMTYDIANIVLFVIAIAIIPGIAAYNHWKVGWVSRNKKRKIAEFIEKSADQQIQAKDGPE